MKLSIVIPAYNSQDILEPCLKSVRSSIHNDYELIVIDDGSRDATLAIAKKYADEVITHEKNLGRSHARNAGIRCAEGDILVFMDSDVIVQPDTLAQIHDYFSCHEEVDALTGLLSKEHPNQNFFSQYKNLYMNYIFKKLPERVNFLYGSICAIRKRSLMLYDHDINIADDTALGQKLSQDGKQIAFLKDLEVVHLKKYSFRSFVKNDFQIPFDWAKIFLKYRGWKALGKNKTGYLHSPKSQLLSVALAPLIFLTLLSSLCVPRLISLSGILMSIWFLVNLRFFMFLAKEKGILFACASVPLTFFDNLIMAAGIFCGLLTCLNSRFLKPPRFVHDV
jgi:glycosyltransferase involved in cell wall biosynthesis